LDKQKVITIILFAVMVIAVYLGCETKSKEILGSEKSRALNFEKLSPNNLIKDSKLLLDDEASGYITTLEAKLSHVEDEAERMVILEQIASAWFSLGYPSVSGLYAEEIAKKQDDGKSWGIAGTTYLLCQKRTENADLKEFCQNRSIKALETATSFEPDNIDHRINLALCYVDSPPETNPMMGIQMLLSMNREHPENTDVILQLGMLGLQTNQIAKATQRFKTVLEIDPENKEAHCQLAKIFQDQGNLNDAEKHLLKCNN